jgi:hypothetical protein
MNSENLNTLVRAGWNNKVLDKIQMVEVPEELEGLINPVPETIKVGISISSPKNIDEKQISKQLITRLAIVLKKASKGDKRFYSCKTIESIAMLAMFGSDLSEYGPVAYYTANEDMTDIKAWAVIRGIFVDDDVKFLELIKGEKNK